MEKGEDIFRIRIRPMYETETAIHCSSKFFFADNLCFFSLSIGNQACKGNRVFQIPRIGVAEDKVAHYASIHYYVDKELQVIILFIL